MILEFYKLIYIYINKKLEIKKYIIDLEINYFLTFLKLNKSELLVSKPNFIIKPCCKNK